MIRAAIDITALALFATAVYAWGSFLSNIVIWEAVL